MSEKFENNRYFFFFLLKYKYIYITEYKRIKKIIMSIIYSV